MVTSVLAIELIPCFFDKTPQDSSSVIFLTDEDFGREGWYDGESYDGIINNFGISLQTAPTSVEEGQSVMISLEVTNLENEYGEMWVQCSILSEDDNPWLADVSRRAGIGYKQPSSLYNCKDEDFTLTGKFFLSPYSTISGFFDIPEFQAEAGEGAVIYCAAYEQCAIQPPLIEQDTYESSSLKRSITILPQQQEPDTYTCTDSDGADGWDTQNTALVQKDGYSYPYDEQEDTCISDTQLKEYYCEASDSSQLGYKYHTCDGSCEDGACVAGTPVTDGPNIQIYRVEVINTLTEGQELWLDKSGTTNEPAVKVFLKNYGDETGTIQLEYGIFPKTFLQEHYLIPNEEYGGVTWYDLSRYEDIDKHEACFKEESFVAAVQITLEPYEELVAPHEGISSVYVTETGLAFHPPNAPTETTKFQDNTSAIDPNGEYAFFTEIYLDCDGGLGNNQGIHKSAHGNITHERGMNIFTATETGTWAYLPIEVTGLLEPTAECTIYNYKVNCNDANHCTEEECVDGTCVWTAIPGCTCLEGDVDYCETDADADDNDASTDDSCDVNTRCSTHKKIEAGECGATQYLWPKLFGDECLDKKISINSSELRDFELDDTIWASYNALKDPSSPYCTEDNQCLEGECIHGDKTGDSLETQVWNIYRDDMPNWLKLAESVTSWIAPSMGIEDFGLCIHEEQSVYSEYFNKLVYFIQDTFDIESFETSKMLSIGILGVLAVLLIGILTKNK